MRMEEWHEVLATVPATATQIGAVHGEYRRLGYSDDDRAAKLAVSAALLDLNGLTSHNELMMGQAGLLLSTLRAIGNRAQLPGLPHARGPVPDTAVHRGKPERPQDRLCEPAAPGAGDHPRIAPNVRQAHPWADAMAMIAAALIALRNPGVMFADRGMLAAGECWDDGALQQIAEKGTGT
jgi:hypothetical protein